MAHLEAVDDDVLRSAVFDDEPAATAPLDGVPIRPRLCQWPQEDAGGSLGFVCCPLAGPVDELHAIPEEVPVLAGVYDSIAVDLVLQRQRPCRRVESRDRPRAVGGGVDVPEPDRATGEITKVRLQALAVRERVGASLLGDPPALVRLSCHLKGHVVLDQPRWGPVDVGVVDPGGLGIPGSDLGRALLPAVDSIGPGDDHTVARPILEPHECNRSARLSRYADRDALAVHARLHGHRVPWLEHSCRVADGQPRSIVSTGVLIRGIGR